jgi:hypothetical protein
MGPGFQIEDQSNSSQSSVSHAVSGDGKDGKIELACGLGITEDAGFKRFNIWPEATGSGRTVCREAIAE